MQTTSFDTLQYVGHPSFFEREFLPIFLLLVIWCLVWKGLALWKAARNESKTWFIVLLILNTIGILEILYIFIFSKYNFTLDKGDKKNPEEEKNITKEIEILEEEKTENK